MGAGSGIVGAFMVLGLIVYLAVVCFPNAGWPLWVVAICTVAFWFVVFVMGALIVLIGIALIWMSD